MKPKAKDNKAEDVETKPRKELAAELGELTLQRAKLVARLNQIAGRCNQIATKMESLK